MLEVGCLLFGQVRDFLERERFKGRNIQWHEGRGWLSRVFTIRGDADDVQRVYWVLKDEES